MRATRRGRRGACLTVMAMVLCIAPRAATAATPAAHWTAITQAAPTYLHPGDTSDFFEIIADNDGSATAGGPIVITDQLPAGLAVNAATAYAEILGVRETSFEEFLEPCTQESKAGAVTLTCTINANVPIGRAVVLNINVQVPEGAAGALTNTATISGGGAPQATTTVTAPVKPASEEAVPFGAALTADATDASGGVASQAGAHPFMFTTLLDFNVAKVNPIEECNEGLTHSCAELNAQAKDIEVALPAGFVVNPTAIPYCTQAQFELSRESCPAASQVGSIYLYFYSNQTAVQYAPVYNIEPPPGEPGELGFTISTTAHISMYGHVRSDGDYGLTADISGINQFDPVRAAALSLWGNPSDEAHNVLRLTELQTCEPGEGCSSGVILPKPFLTMPTSCSAEPLAIPIAGDSWQERKPAPYPHLGEASIPGMTGCDQLRFNPSLTAQPSSHRAGAPTGYELDLKVPQNEELNGLATPSVRNVEVTLPEGTVVSPSGANGLVACSAAQFELTQRAKGHCPSASKIGSVEITTPLLKDKVNGALYVGEPECSPCSPSQAESGQMVHLLLEAEGSGVVIKREGHTRISQAGGQLTAVFTENPQLPFSDLHVSLEQGPGAPLVNSSTCGSTITTAAITPWSTTTASKIAAPEASIEGCAPEGFAPSFRAGATTSAKSGAFTGFSVTMSRADGEQKLGRVSVTTPPGMLGVLKSVEQCSEAAANAGTCSGASQIGTGSFTLGAGSTPLTINGGKVYLTGPYEGKPFGLSIVAPAQAGPFVLAGNAGNGTEVVRASIAIDPHTSALTVTSDPLPQQLNGVPLSIRTINIDINREGFTFNPTNCDAMSVNGVIVSATGTISNASFPFQATDCGILPFRPRFTATTQGKTSKKNGASLHVRVTSGHGQANIGKVKVSLPIQLPSRLATLQKACIDSVFEANPASCPAASAVGQATAITPLLKRPLTGPAYLVSHAGRAFPDLQIVLQGEGINLVLTGNTDIKKGVTSSTFKAVPDAPITSFDLVLPEGPHSVFAAFGNLCTSTLNMPTIITGQNGAVIKQTTKIAATGCPKRKTSKHSTTKKG